MALQQRLRGGIADRYQGMDDAPVGTAVAEPHKLESAVIAPDLFTLESSSADEKRMTKTISKPRRVVGTLFLDPATPPKKWREEIDRGDFSEVYISIQGKEIEPALQFAAAVREATLQKYVMADPVVIGPVSCKLLADHQIQIDELGLRISDLGERAYASMSRSEEGFRRSRRSQVGRSR